jgi:hypothetical protein
MKAWLVLVVLAVLGLAAAGCGSGTKKLTAGSITVTAVGTTTIASVATGTMIRCKPGTAAGVPPPGHGVTGNADGPKVSSMIQVTHRGDGSAVVVCRHS